MIFSSSRKFVFFAVPKTGTHSVREQLRPLLAESDWEQQLLTGRMLSPLKPLAEIGHGHISYVQLASIVGEHTVRDMHRFAFVRHPIDRFMSACAFLARTDPSYNDDPIGWAQRALALWMDDEWHHRTTRGGRACADAMRWRPGSDVCAVGGAHINAHEAAEPKPPRGTRHVV